MEGDVHSLTSSFEDFRDEMRDSVRKIFSELKSVTQGSRPTASAVVGLLTFLSTLIVGVWSLGIRPIQQQIEHNKETRLLERDYIEKVNQLRVENMRDNLIHAIDYNAQRTLVNECRIYTMMCKMFPDATFVPPSLDALEIRKRNRE